MFIYIFIITKMTTVPGVQQLFAAEKEAAERIADAKKHKAQKLKLAKEEFQSEIDRYRAEKEIELKKFQDQHKAFREEISTNIEAETQLKIEEMSKAVNSNKEAVIQRILEIVYDIKPEVHRNFRPDE